MTITYRIGGTGCGPAAISLPGKKLPFTREVHSYRTGSGGPITERHEELTAGTNELIVYLGYCSRGWLMAAYEGYADARHWAAKVVP